MRVTEQQKRAIALGAVAVGAVLVAQAAWRRRHAYDFAGRSVVITGGSRGLGLVMSRQLAAEGARLTLIARDGEDLSRAADELRSEYPDVDVYTVAADLRSREEAERAVIQAAAHHGRIDVLINNAGSIQVGPIEHMHLADYEDAMQTHFWGPLYMIGAVLPHMRRQGGGRIVNISSIGGRISVPHLVPYSASKFALAGLSEGLRSELAPDNVIVTTVFPGLMRTGSPVNALFKGQRPQEYAWFTISDSLPLTSINAERAGKQVIDACRYGDAELVITTQAKLAILARFLAPELFADAMTFISGLLPGPSTRDGDEARPGREQETDIAGPESRITGMTYAAARRNNEL